MKKPFLSFIIPLYNEEENLLELHSQLNQVLKTKLASYGCECIFINDGSTDNSLDLLKSLQRKDSRVKVISFRRNLGKSAALNSGFRKAKGQYMITLDSDLQDGPENIPALLSESEKGYDLVVGWKQKRKDPLNKTIPSRIFNYFVRMVSRISLHDFNSGLKIFRSEVVSELFLYGELHRFIPVLVHQRGFKITEIPVVHHPRKNGTTKYGWDRFLKGFFDFLTVIYLGAFGQRPLHLFGLVGLIGIILGIIFGGYLTYLHFIGISISRRPLLILAVLLIVAGLQLLSTGLIAEMIVNRSKSEERLPIDYETD